MGYSRESLVWEKMEASPSALVASVGMVKCCLALCVAVTLQHCTSLLAWLVTQRLKKIQESPNGFMFCSRLYDYRRIFMSDVKYYLMFLLLLPCSSGVWYCNRSLNYLGSAPHRDAFLCQVG